MTPEQKEQLNEDLDLLNDVIYASPQEALLEISATLGNYGISFPLTPDIEEEMVFGLEEEEGAEIKEYLYIMLDPSDVTGIELFTTIVNQEELDYLDSNEDTEDDPMVVVSRRAKNRRTELTGGNTSEYA